MPRFGERVGAIDNADGKKVWMYGYGIYVGMVEEGSPTSFANPKIILDDNRGVVWGSQCWWGSEKIVKQRVEGLELEFVDLPGERME